MGMHSMHRVAAPSVRMSLRTRLKKCIGVLSFFDYFWLEPIFFRQLPAAFVNARQRPRAAKRPLSQHSTCPPAATRLRLSSAPARLPHISHARALASEEPESTL